MLSAIYPFPTLLYQGPESRKERNERERRFLEVRSRKKVEEKRSSREEEHGGAYLPTLSEKALKYPFASTPRLPMLLCFLSPNLPDPGMVPVRGSADAE